MKFTAFLFVLALSLKGKSQSSRQFSDSNLARKLSVSGFCLCRTTVDDLRKLDPDLKEVSVIEMDLCNDGFTQDSRFVNRKGYSSNKYPGLIFQKDQDNDLISKIRMTRDFVGRLPDGTPVDLRKMPAKEAMRIFPSIADQWRTRGCSEYIHFSNDTISFYIKINRLKTPLYPIDETYYREQPVEAIELAASCYSILRHDEQPYSQLFNDPVMFMDSLNVTRLELSNVKPEDIAMINVYRDSNAIKRIGPQGKYGVIYITTKKFARTRYWNYFRTKSADYEKAILSPASDSNVVYILNGKPLIKDPEADLVNITDDTFIDLQLIDEKELLKRFAITDKKWGIVIRKK